MNIHENEYLDDTLSIVDEEEDDENFSDDADINEPRKRGGNRNLRHFERKQECPPEEPQNTGRIHSPRFTKWISLFVCSLIAMGSSLEAAHDYKKNRHIAIITTTTSFFLTLFTILLHTHPQTTRHISNTPLEAFLLIILFVIWIITVSIVSNPTNGMALNLNGEVSFGNLYYFGWAGLINVVVLGVSWVKSVHHLDLAVVVVGRGKRLLLWCALMVVGIVVMVSSTIIYDGFCGKKGSSGEEDGYEYGNNRFKSSVDLSRYCNRTVLAIVMGCLTTIFSLLLSGLKTVNRMEHFKLEAALIFCLFVGNAFNVAYVTSDYGPGAPLGNLYYFSWLAFGLSFVLGATCYEDYQAGGLDGERSEGLVEEEGRRLRSGNDNEGEWTRI